MIGATENNDQCETMDGTDAATQPSAAPPHRSAGGADDGRQTKKKRRRDSDDTDDTGKSNMYMLEYHQATHDWDT